jgi:hypothetical protein
MEGLLHLYQDFGLRCFPFWFYLSDLENNWLPIYYALIHPRDSLGVFAPLADVSATFNVSGGGGLHHPLNQSGVV